MIVLDHAQREGERLVRLFDEGETHGRGDRLEHPRHDRAMGWAQAA
jgi:hypothetical protein